MKKFILSAFLPLLYFLCAAFFSVPFSRNGAKAKADENGYACIRAENVYLYSEENDRSGLFVLPYSYYVRILSTGIKYAHVEYLSDGPNTRKITGYCKTSDLTFVDYTPVRPYLYHSFDVTYYIQDAPPTGEDGFLSGITVSCSYYGDYKVGSKTYCYVYRDGVFGYIPKPLNLVYEQNDEYDNRNALDSASSAGNHTSKEAMPPAQIAILVILCILVPVIAALILRPSKKPPYEPDE